MTVGATETTLSLLAAAELHELNRRALSKAAVAGRLTAMITGTATGTRIRFDPFTLARELDELPRCGCGWGRPALTENGGCGSCGYGQRGRPRTRTYEHRHCAACGKDLGLVAVTRTAGAKPTAASYCDADCRRAHLPPRRERSGDTLTCPGCGKTRYLKPSAIGDGEGRCIECVNAERRNGDTLTCPGCGKTRYRPPSLVGTTGGYCLNCYRASDQAAEALSRAQGELARLAEAFEAAKKAPGVFTLRDCGRELGVSHEAVRRWIHAGDLDADRHATYGGLAYLITADAIRDLKRRQAARVKKEASERGLLRRWLDEAWVLDHDDEAGLTERRAERDGISRREARRRRREQVVRRWELIRPFLAGRTSGLDIDRALTLHRNGYTAAETALELSSTEAAIWRLWCDRGLSDDDANRGTAKLMRRVTALLADDTWWLRDLTRALHVPAPTLREILEADERVTLERRGRRILVAPATVTES